ncbi:sialate O-acetylesterase [Sphingomonas radiodurans]|uniref:sialate O-acetylesterase n=1 Tax=Sphingomonas radiodurans TaxID=2890321 RepID=UPI001E545BDA|nr:sialate O-acetylesterase [Sphingomonas radiodurans]WBH15515.1 9-O-acetylesterase [Sphingomonas radiodurans]
MPTLRASIIPLALLATASAVQAAPRLDGVVSDHAVLQRGQPIVLTGDAMPGETVLVSLAGRSTVVTAGRNGRFEARLPAMTAGGPYDLTVAAPSGGAVVRDILLGDVYLCSGQSNMEMSVDRAQDMIPDANPAPDAQLRLLTVTKKSAAAPIARFADAPDWEIAGPASVPGFSAACFYMAQSLRRTAKVPIGAIHASWGGSRISAWMSDPALRAAGLSADADRLALYGRDPAAANRDASAVWEAWWRAQSGDVAGAEPWQPNAALDWREVPRIGNFEEWGVPELADYNGMLWFQREVTVTADQARGPAILALGAVDDADRTWVNGRGVGGNSLAGQPRVYALAAGTLKAGRNVITVNVDDGYAFGGMTGPVEAMRLTFADGSSLPISAGWRYAIAKPVKGGAPRVAWDDINGAGTLFNAMIAPLGRTPVAGIAWYQGESDTGLPGYDRRLSAMVADWRRRLDSPNAAIAVVQLANYGEPSKAPAESGWADVRDAQRRVTAADAHGGMAVSLDLGDPRDIHPGQKHEVGERLARVMRARVYGEAVPPAGPAIASATQGPDGSVTLRFTGVDGALHAQGSAVAIGFELCGAAPEPCRYAAGRVSGSEVILAGDGRAVTRIRYAWSDAPATNLADDAHLPVGTFEIAVPPLGGTAR